MSAAARRLLALVVAIAVTLTGSALAHRSVLIEHLTVAQSRAEVLDAHLDDARHSAQFWSETFAGRNEKSALFGRLLDARETFVASVGSAKAAIASAQGKVDTAAQVAAIHALQDTVVEERLDPAVVVAAAGQVDAATTKIAADVAAYDAEQRRLAAERAAAAGGGSRAATGPRLASAGSAYDRVRAALNRVGGGGVTLEQYDGACGTVSAAACALPAGIIRFTPSLATWSDARLHWAMAHEYAHIRQFAVWGTLMRSGTYAALFNGNIELLANCMAHQRGYPSGNVSCSGAQLDFSASIWNGSVPG